MTARTFALGRFGLMGQVFFAAAAAAASASGGMSAADPARDLIRPVPLAAVQVQDEFWAPRLKANRTVTIRHNLGWLERRGSLGGFARLAGRKVEKYRGYMWADSDVYKTIEGILYSLQTHPDPALEARAEEIITAIIGAQAPDGYLMPHIQIAEPKYRHFTHETSRTCESYSMGHMIESAVAHHQATGRKQYLEAAKRCADLLARVQGGGKLEQISGHPGVELALVKLYRATKDRKYLQLARSYVLNAKSHSSLWSRGKPFLADGQAWGHAVAATYLYCGATDVAALTGDAELLGLIDRKWENVVSKKLYITGGVGLPPGEAYGAEYDLPNAGAYCETCASIATVFWNHRLFGARGDAKYLDVLERTLYNGALSGVALGGDRFFYVNRLACLSPSRRQRKPWHGCACCPTNVVRFMPQVPGYVYATRGEGVFVNLFVSGRGQVRLNGQAVTVTQQTRYPWDGRVRMTVEPEQAATFSVCVRIPGWARGRPVPSDLYRYADAGREKVALKVNGESVALEVESGFARIRRTWKRGDTIDLDLPMPIRRVIAHSAVQEDVGRVALERGPIVYCLEGVDHDGTVSNIVLPDEAKLHAEHRANLLGGVTVLRGTARALHRDADGTVAAKPITITAVPYYAWSHRGTGEMAVWLARMEEKATPARQPPATVAGPQGGEGGSPFVPHFAFRIPHSNLTDLTSRITVQP